MLAESGTDPLFRFALGTGRLARSEPPDRINNPGHEEKKPEQNFNREGSSGYRDRVSNITAIGADLGAGRPGRARQYLLPGVWLRECCARRT